MPITISTGLMKYRNQNGTYEDINAVSYEAGVATHICSSNEYNATTRIPTVQNPEENIFYLVPAENGTSPDMFVEWIYANNAWERFGNVTLDIPVEDVQINGSSIVNNGVANFPIISNNEFGVAKTGNNYGIFSDNGVIKIDAASETYCKEAQSAYRPIVPAKQHASTFYGLAKAAGDTTQSQSNNAVGTYTSEAKTAIRSMLGAAASSDIPSVPVQDVQVNGTSIVSNGVANVPVAGYDTYGTIKIGYATSGLVKDSADYLKISPATSAHIKSGTEIYNPVTPYKQHESAFYGLAKAAGDSTQASSDNAVGIYTAGAKTAIQTMLGVPGDVQVNGTSVVSNGVANVPVASMEGTYPGVVSVDSNYGVYLRSDGKLSINNSGDSQIKAGVNEFRPIVPNTQHKSIFYGLAKAAGDSTQASSDNAIGTYTADAKTAIQSMLGVPGDVQVNGTSIVSNGVANIPVATSDTLGLVKVYSPNGISIDSNNQLAINYPSDNQIKVGEAYFRPIVPALQHKSVFYGLAKAAGDSTQAQSNNAVGTYTADAKSAIQSMLGVPGDVQVNGTSVVSNGVANIPKASNDGFGVVKTGGYGVRINNDGVLYVYPAGISSEVKAGASNYLPIVPSTQHAATFYGLAKAAGVDISSSNNAIGTYTTEAKAAIHTMLGIDPAAIATQVEIPLIETVSGTTPVITGQPNTRYNCGEVSTISITPPVSGSIDVFFESGSTAAVLTVPNTVKWPEWFDASSLEADTVYEILITDGVYGSVMTWAA